MAECINKVQYDINKTCRACLKVENILKSIINYPLGDMFTKFTNLEVSESDGLPSKLCSHCIEKLNDSLAFLELCISSDGILKQNKIIKSENDEIKIETTHFVSVSGPVSALEVNCLSKYENETNSEILFSEENNSVKAESIADHIDTDDFIESDEFDETEENNQIKIEYIEISTLKDSENIEKLPKLKSKQIKKSTILQKEGSSKCENITEIDTAESELLDYNLYLKCPRCGEKFKSSGRLGAHFREHILKTPKICHMCNLEFIRVKEFSAHMIKEHPKCFKCGEYFNSKSELAEHRKIHQTVRRSIMCHICGKTCGRDLKTHMKNKHSDEKPFTCHLCPKSFKSAFTLKMHLHTHSGTKRYTCSICGHETLTGYNLKRHMASHTDEKPFLCPICPKRYKTKAHLSGHKKVHTGERPFACDLCPMKFRDSRILKHHRLLHTGEKPHVCDICNRSFTQKVALVAHMKVHKK